MYRLTTPVFTFTFPTDFDMSVINVDNAIVTFADRKSTILLEKTGSNLVKQDNHIMVFLDQSETQLFTAGKEIKTQINWKYTESGTVKRACTNIVTCTITENLHDDIM